MKSIYIKTQIQSFKYKKSGCIGYALFYGEKLVGFIEAKKYSQDVVAI